MSVWELLSSPEAGRSHRDGGRHGAARHGGGPVRGGGDAVGGGGEAEREIRWGSGSGIHWCAEAARAGVGGEGERSSGD